jgi:hypothetical protein
MLSSDSLRWQIISQSLSIATSSDVKQPICLSYNADRGENKGLHRQDICLGGDNKFIREGEHCLRLRHNFLHSGENGRQAYLKIGGAPHISLLSSAIFMTFGTAGNWLTSGTSPDVSPTMVEDYPTAVDDSSTMFGVTPTAVGDTQTIFGDSPTTVGDLLNAVGGSPTIVEGSPTMIKDSPTAV